MGQPLGFGFGVGDDPDAPVGSTSKEGGRGHTPPLVIVGISGYEGTLSGEADRAGKGNPRGLNLRYSIRTISLSVPLEQLVDRIGAELHGIHRNTLVGSVRQVP